MARADASTIENQMTASDGEGPDADSNLFNIQVIQYVPLSWDAIPDWHPVIGGGEQTFDVRSYLNGTNAATALITGVTPTQLPVDNGYSWDGSVLTFLDTTQVSAELDLQADDGIGPPAASYFDVFPEISIDLVSAEWTINNKNGTLDSRDPDYSFDNLSWNEPLPDVAFVEGLPGTVDVRSRLSGSNAATAVITNSGTDPNDTSFNDGLYDYGGGGSADGPYSQQLTADDGVTSPQSSAFDVEVSAATGSIVAEPGFVASGSAENGGLLTISFQSGGGFGAKQGGGKPLYFIDAGQNGIALPSDPRARLQAPSGFWEIAQQTQAIVKPGSAYSMGVDVKQGEKYWTATKELGVSSVTSRHWQHQISWFNNWTVAEMGSWPDEGNPNIKWSRWETAGAQKTPYTVYTMQGSTQRFFFGGSEGPDDGGGDYDTTFDMSNYNVKKWRNETGLVLNSSSPSSYDAGFNLIINGKQRDTRAGVRSHNDGSNPLIWDHFKPIGFSNYWYQPLGKTFNYDFIYLDNSWCRILISDMAVFDESSEHDQETQIPMVWSDTSVQVSVRYGALTGDVTGKYLWIVTDDGTPFRVARFT